MSGRTPGRVGAGAPVNGTGGQHCTGLRPLSPPINRGEGGDTTECRRGDDRRRVLSDGRASPPHRGRAGCTGRRRVRPHGRRSDAMTSMTRTLAGVRVAGEYAVLGGVVAV